MSLTNSLKYQTLLVQNNNTRPKTLSHSEVEVLVDLRRYDLTSNMSEFDAADEK